MVLSDLEAMQLVVALSESEIGNVHVGQIATLTIEALNGRKVAAHVTQVAQTPTSTSGAVSYDVTFKLDQGAAGSKSA
jgi:HlyD family secretion protein